jgi:hypothetical protein
MKKISIAVLVALFALLINIPVNAKTPALKDPLVKADFTSEHMAGGTNASTGLGNGRMTVGISPWSELIYLRWPRPSMYDQLRYTTKAYGFWLYTNPRDVRWDERAPGPDWQRYGRPYEVHPGLGARGGIYLADGTLSWFGDPSWISSRAYEPEWSDVLCTKITRKGAAVNACQWVDWEDDIMVQDFTIDSDSALKFFYYGTFDPNEKKGGYWGVPDPKSAGFATVYLEDQGVVLYFLPVQKKIPYKFDQQLKDKITPALIDRLYPDGGQFIALALSEKPDGFQVGADRKGRPATLSAPPAASENAKKGKLNGSKYYIGQSDSGLEKSISQKDRRVVVFVTAGNSAKEAVALIEKARARGVDQLRAKATADWKPMADQVELPANATAPEKRVARRSVLNLFVGRDKQSGAIIASPSRQPAYHFDWPRDGSFYDLSLDLAGFHDIVSSHIDFYQRTQRKETRAFGIARLLGGQNLFYSPKGHWVSNIYTDGSPGKLSIIPVEIDETALLTWDLWRHEQYIPQADRPAYGKSHLEELTLAADALLEYVDVPKGWTKKVNEDDNPFPSATLHGAASVLAGLSAAVDAGKRWGADPAKVEKWREAAIALRKGIIDRIARNDKSVEQGGWRGIQWALFPAPVFESFDDPGAQKLIKKLATDIEEKASKKRPGFGYLGEQVFILGIATAKQPQYKPIMDQAMKVLVNEMPIPGSDCYGEVTILIDMPEGKVSQQRTSIPHLWTGVTSYLAVESLYRPERFLSQIPPVPK